MTRLIGFGFVALGLAACLWAGPGEDRRHPKPPDAACANGLDVVVGELTGAQVDQLRMLRTDDPGTAIPGPVSADCTPRKCSITCGGGECSASAGPGWRAVCGCAAGTAACWLAMCE